MRTILFHRLARSLVMSMSIVSFLSTLVHAATWDPAAGDYSGNKGRTIYVSKKGDNSDGSSWQKAFHAIQAALAAVADDQGGHRVIVRPDRYIEMGLYPIQKGAPGSYNLLIGDTDGSLGSGATGRIIIDTSCPGVAVRPDPTGTYTIIHSNEPESGCKSVDYWGPILCGPIKVKSPDGKDRCKQVDLLLNTRQY